MDVRMPNGVLIKNVPDGTNKYVVLAKALERGIIKPEDIGQQSYSPTGSTLQNLMAGYGKAGADIVQGAGQRLGMVSPHDVERTRKLDQPLMDTKAGLVGNIAGNVADLTPAMFVPGGNTMAGAALTGAAAGLLMPTGEGESAGRNMAIGAGMGAIGQGVAQGVGRMMQPFQNVLPESSKPLLDVAARENIPLSAANVTGNKALEIVDSVLDYMPFAAGRQAAQKTVQKEAWTKAIMRHLGVDNATDASPTVLESARSAIGAQFEDIAARNTVTLGDDFLDSLIKAESKINMFSSPKARANVEKALKLAAKASENGGVVPGAEYQSIRSTLIDESERAFKNRKSSLGRVISDIVDGLDEAMLTSAGPDDAQLWQQARTRWKILKQVEKATKDGELSPKKFFNELERSSTKTMKYGKGDQDLADLARIGTRMVAENVPNSGTAQRLMWQRILGGAGGMAAMSGMIPPAAIAGAAMGAGTSLAAQKALWAGGRAGKYLTQGLLPDSPLMARIGNVGRGAASLGGAVSPLYLPQQ